MLAVFPEPEIPLGKVVSKMGKENEVELTEQ